MPASERKYTAAAKSLQSCPTLYDPIDGSPPGSAIPGILQARILEWVAISFSNHESKDTLAGPKMNSGCRPSQDPPQTSLLSIRHAWLCPVV